MTNIVDLNGAPIAPEELDESAANEQMAQLFEELAAEARAGKVENYVVITMYSPFSHNIKCWNKDTLRLVGACEAAKHDILNFASSVTYLEDGTDAG